MIGVFRTLKKRKGGGVLGNINESVVLVGGGGGVFRVAKFLKHIRPKITTVQTTFDDGGHSGILRDERGVLPPGDIRQAILALSDDRVESEFHLRSLFSHRFAPKGSSSLDSATVGNILLTAYTEITGSMITAIDILCRIFGVKGKVLPVSLSDSKLCVKFSDGTELEGECAIDKRSTKDKRVIASAFLRPEAHIYHGAYEALVGADKIIFCPGDLFTSVIPNTLVKGFSDAIKESRAKLIMVVNIMTKKAESNKFKASDFARVLLGYIGRDFFDAVICNNGNISEQAKKSYKKESSEIVIPDIEELKKYSKKVFAEDLVDEVGGIVRHNGKTAHIIAGI